VGAQSLLANLKVHFAVASAVLWLGAAAGGWRALGAAGAVAGIAFAAAVVLRAPWAPAASPPEGTATIDVALFNILFDNPRGAEIADALIATPADIAVILEAAPLADYLDRLSSAYPYQIGCGQGRCDTLILSRLPFRHATWLGPAYATTRLAQVEVETVVGPLTLFAAHWTRSFFSTLRGQEATALIRAGLKHVRAGGGPFIVVGDFNAAIWDPSLMRVTRRLALRGAGGWTPTWPARLSAIGLQIDHILVGPGVGVAGLEALPDSLGSNHRGLRAKLFMTTASGAGS
jgi:endonuclease/exonuclease/phosphatase (EEP) superfamily protein YafD